MSKRLTIWSREIGTLKTRGSARSLSEKHPADNVTKSRQRLEHTTAGERQSNARTQNLKLYGGEGIRCNHASFKEVVRGLTRSLHTTHSFLVQVLEEFRVQELTPNTHAFLHGDATTVLGSWLHGRASCGERECQTLPQRWKEMGEKTPWEQKRQMECYACHREGEARMRVIPPGAAGEPRAASCSLSDTFGGFFRHSCCDPVVYCRLGYLDCLSFARLLYCLFGFPE